MKCDSFESREPLAGCPASPPQGQPRGSGAAAHLDLLDGVHDEGVLQVLHGPLHPVVEGRRPLGVLQVQLVDGLQQFFCPLGVPNGVGEGSRSAELYPESFSTPQCLLTRPKCPGPEVPD